MYPFSNKQWTKRSKLIANMISPCSRVIDFGAGEENLKKFLKDCEYYPVDIYPCTENTIVMDLNGPVDTFLPKVDFLVAQGLLEYLNDPLKFLKAIKPLGDTLITTYRFEFGRPGMERKNSFERAEVYKLFEEAGWKGVMREKMTPNHYIFFCKK